MSYKANYDKGNWKSICDSCGRVYKASDLRKRWDGLLVCPQDWEIRQPQDFVRGVLDTQTPPWVRTESQDTFLGGGCTITSIAGLAIATCMIAGNTTTPGAVPTSSFTL